MKKLILLLAMILVTVLASAEPYKERQRKDAYIKEHGGHRYESGVRSNGRQVEFGNAREYKGAFDRAEENADWRKPKVIISPTPDYKKHKIKSDARKRGIELEFEDD